jgi:hypothetical protein
VGSVLVGWDQVWWCLRGAGSGQVGWDDVGRDQVVPGRVELAGGAIPTLWGDRGW